MLYRWFPSVLKAITIIRPETLVRWHRAGFRRYWRWKSRSLGGRPKIDADLRALIWRMSAENSLRGAPRIHGELLKLGFEVVSPASRSIWSSDVDTIHDVIMARIDRLEETAKQTLQLASVIGREFTRRLLDRIAQARGRTEQLLRDLKAIELIYEKSLFPELAYMFKHALTHEVMDEVLRRHRHLLGLQVRNDRRAHSSSAARLKPDRTPGTCS